MISFFFSFRKDTIERRESKENRRVNKLTMNSISWTFKENPFSGNYIYILDIFTKIVGLKRTNTAFIQLLPHSTAAQALKPRTTRKKTQKTKKEDPKWNCTTQKFPSLRIHNDFQKRKQLNSQPIAYSIPPTNPAPTFPYSVKTTYIRVLHITTYKRNFFNFLFTLAK
uniref:Uncharacterized protein n=1 Tax=Opuntia streptacantha TaxID=393608 RepID=A0A7C9E816_OPUST